MLSKKEIINKLNLLILFTIIINISNIFQNQYLYSENKKNNNICEYNKLRDKQFILNMFKKNWYWLVDEDDDKDFSPEYMLDTKSSSNNEKDKGNLNIKVFVEDNITKGFITYYTEINSKNKSKYGIIFTLAVDEKYRNKGIAKELLKYAIKDLKNNLKCDNIYLYTRINNEPAIKCYIKFGFNIIDYNKDIGILQLEYKKNK